MEPIQINVPWTGLYGLYFSDTNNGYIGGGGYFIARTSDRGSNFQIENFSGK
jgi:hypothetical protein